MLAQETQVSRGAEYVAAAHARRERCCTDCYVGEHELCSLPSSCPCETCHPPRVASPEGYIFLMYCEDVTGFHVFTDEELEVVLAQKCRGIDMKQDWVIEQSL